MHDQLGNGTKFRALTVVDVFSRKGLAIEIGQRLKGEHVVEVLNRLVRQRGAPKYLFADNGAAFTGQLVDLWAYHHGVRIDFSRPGKSTDNAFIETFNGLLRDDRRMRRSEPALVRDAGRSPVHHREVAKGLQREPASHGSRLQDATGISIAQKPFRVDEECHSRRRLTLDLDHQSKAPHGRRTSHIR